MPALRGTVMTSLRGELVRGEATRGGSARTSRGKTPSSAELNPAIEEAERDKRGHIPAYRMSQLEAFSPEARKLFKERLSLESKPLVSDLLENPTAEKIVRLAKQYKCEPSVLWEALKLAAFVRRLA